MDSKFEKASRLQLRYSVGKGQSNTEDLWTLSLEDLNTLAKSLNKEIKEATEESFIKTKTKASTTLELKFEIVKHVIEVKLAERQKRLLAAEKAQKRAQLEELISRRELTELESKSVEELRAELVSLDADLETV